MRAKAYWICQAAGWSFWAIANVLFFALTNAGITARGLVSAAVASALGLTISHGYRAVVRARRWTSLRLLSLGPRLIAASVAQAILLIIGMTAFGYATASGQSTSAARGALVLFAFNFSVVFLGWSLIYFGVHWLERSRRAERAELGFLKSQLNPHFLFNSLNSIRALVVEDPERAQAAVTRLAKLLRAVLGAANLDTVSLARELEVVEDYLALESVRFEERLRVKVDVADDARPIEVPSMLVQTLVENGIKHGISRRTGGGEIEVHAHVRRGVLEIDVANTAADGARAGRASGVGLANATERLELLFGSRATLRLDQSSRDRVVAEVRIPIR